MASNNPVRFKVFIKNENCKEVKRFVVDDASVVTNFLFMKEKLKLVFPTLRDANFKLTWMDADGDEITIDSDEDLMTAFTEMTGELIQLYVTILDTNPDIVLEFHEPQRKRKQHFRGEFKNMFLDSFGSNIVCDVCDKRITGYRYKCMQCPDYDLCVECEYHGHHPDHIMLRTSKFYPLGRCGKKMFDHINRTMRKVNHMAYKEATNAAKFKKRDKHDDKKKCHEGKSNPCQNDNEAPNVCPMTNINLEHITPMIYPFLDAINNQMQNPPSTSEQQPSNEPNTSTASNPIANIIKNAINGFLDATQGAQPAQTPRANEGVQTPQNVPTTSASGTTPQQPTSQNVPMEVEKEIDLTKSPVHTPPEQRREPGWTMLFNEHGVQTPTAPNNENAKIADGLKQLLDMGFTDQIGLVALLKRFDGNVGQVVKYIFENNV